MPKSADSLRSQSAKKRSGSHKFIEEVLRCKPVFFNFFNWTIITGNMAKEMKQSHFCFYLQNNPLKFGVEFIYTPSRQNLSGKRLFNDQNLKGA